MTDRRDDNQVQSLSFEDVNTNPDELIELRGGGRYFGVIDPSGNTINNVQSLGPICANCHKRGHIRAKCKTVICHKCGVVGDHYETQCPTTMICAKCGNKGHKAMDCTNKARKKQYCNHCDLFNHNDDNCPYIWRSYILKKKSDDAPMAEPSIWCYNCGDEGHYGDDCKIPRSSRIPNVSGSAFSGNNLPVKYRKGYFDKIHDNRLPKRPAVGSDNSSSRPKRKYDYGSNNNGYYDNYYNSYNSHQEAIYNKYSNYQNNGYNSNNNYNNDYSNNAKKVKPSRSGVIKGKNFTEFSRPSGPKNGFKGGNNSKSSNNKPNNSSGSNKKNKSSTRSGMIDQSKYNNFY